MSQKSRALSCGSRQKQRKFLTKITNARSKRLKGALGMVWRALLLPPYRCGGERRPARVLGSARAFFGLRTRYIFSHLPWRKLRGLPNHQPFRSRVPICPRSRTLRRRFFHRFHSKSRTGKGQNACPSGMAGLIPLHAFPEPKEADAFPRFEKSARFSVYGCAVSAASSL